MRIQAVSREVSVVCLIIYSKREVAIREDEVSQVEVTDETLGGVGVVTITELTIEYQTVVPLRMPSYSALLNPSSPVEMLAPKFHLLLFTKLESTVLIC